MPSPTCADRAAPPSSICNQCPHVKASIGRIVAEAKALREIGIGTIAIMPNDAEAYREDSFDNVKVFAAKMALRFSRHRT